MTGASSDAQLSDGNLWLHVTRSSDRIGEHPSVPVLNHGEGCYVGAILDRVLDEATEKMEA